MSAHEWVVLEAAPEQVRRLPRNDTDARLLRRAELEQQQRDALRRYQLATAVQQVPDAQS